MRCGISPSGVSSILGVLGGLAVIGSAWSQPGTVLTEQKISNTQGNFTATLDNLDEFGGAVAYLGDLDGPGPSVAALAVGAIGDDDGGSGRGCVYILFLDSAGNTLSYQKISNTQGNFTATLNNVDEFGSSVASLGDLDGPGPSAVALAVGAVGDDDGGLERGCVYVLFLSSTGSVLSYQKISDTQGNFTATIDNADEFGGAVAGLGDLDGAGPSAGALAVGAIGDDDGGTDRGCVYVLFLSSTGSVLSYQKISSTQGNFTAPIDNLDEIGGSVAWLGDLDGAGPSVAALAMGAPGDDDGGASRGAMYVLYLSSTGSVLSYQKISDTQGNFTAPLVDLDELGGAAVGLGDLDGPGPSVATLAVGAIGDDDGGIDRGAVYVLFLASNGTVLSYQKISDTRGNFNGVLDDGDDFGGSLTALGDINGAGLGGQTLVVGATGDDDGGGGRGAVYLLGLVEGTLSAAHDGPPSAPAYLLGQARPNPFNPGTTIPFRIDAAGWVQIAIWDGKGRLVRNLFHKQTEPGVHEARWDGLDDSGRPLGSGTYFYRMSVNGRAVGAAGKAVLLK